MFAFCPSPPTLTHVIDVLKIQRQSRMPESFGLEETIINGAVPSRGQTVPLGKVDEPGPYTELALIWPELAKRACDFLRGLRLFW